MFPLGFQGLLTVSGLPPNHPKHTDRGHFKCFGCAYAASLKVALTDVGLSSIRCCLFILARQKQWEQSAAPLPPSTLLRTMGSSPLNTLGLSKAFPHTPARNLLAEVHESKGCSWALTYSAHQHLN